MLGSITTPMPPLWRKPSGVRGVGFRTSFMQPLAPVSAQESFLTAAFIMEGRALLRKAAIWGSIATALFAIAGNAAASKRWRRVPRAADVHGRDSGTIGK